jgi:hypothetical protein
MVAANPNVPPTSRPLADPQALVTVVEQLRQGVGSLAGHRGGALDRAVTLNDLVTLGLVSAATITAKLGS